MICTSLKDKTLPQLQEILGSGEIEMAEIRLDLCPLTLDEIAELFEYAEQPLIATCRAGKSGAGEGAEHSWSDAEARLAAAVEAGAAYLDLELEAPPAVGKRLRRLCSDCGTVMIRSVHNFTATPPLPVLKSLAERARSFGGDIVKIVTTARSEADMDTVMSLYDAAAPGTLVAFAMGWAGRNSRLECLAKGAPWTYAALSAEDATAPGQWTLAQLNERIYGSFRLLHPEEPLPMPSSKSFAQRAIVAAALANGTSHLAGYSPCGDNDSAIALVRSLGATVDIHRDTLTITGITAAKTSASNEIHVGESGFLTRFTIPIVAAMTDKPVRFTGEKTLLNRPLSGAHDIMAAFGVRLQPEDRNLGGSISQGRKIDCYLPLTVTGPLIPGRADIDGKGGSQLISGLLAALPMTEGRSTLYVHNPRSIPYLFITVDVLRRFGIDIKSEMEGDDEFLESGDWGLCTGITFNIKGGQHYRAADFHIEADWSGAAAFLVAGAIFGAVTVTGLDTHSLQADLSIMDVLINAGACVSEGESDLRVVRAPLLGFDVDLNNCPDLFPMVAVLAAFSEGESHILGAQRLAHKETDRAAAIVEMLTAMGVLAAIDEDCLTVRGQTLVHRLLTGNLLKGGEFTSHGDHRMVMALSVASLGAATPVRIDDTSCVAKSFPGFMELFEKLAPARS